GWVERRIGQSLVVEEAEMAGQADALGQLLVSELVAEDDRRVDRAHRRNPEDGRESRDRYQSERRCTRRRVRERAHGLALDRGSMATSAPAGSYDHEPLHSSRSGP